MKPESQLKAMGSTCFVDPIHLATKVVAEVRASNPGHVHSVLFMSDGEHNSGGSVQQVLAAVHHRGLARRKGALAGDKGVGHRVCGAGHGTGPWRAVQGQAAAICWAVVARSSAAKAASPARAEGTLRRM